MRLLERRQELVERDASEISIMWKLLQMFFYLVSAVSGYVTSYAFYIFQDSLNQRCLLWAVPNFDHGIKLFFRSMTTATEEPWQERLMIQFKSERHCYSILLISMLSCVCGIIGFSFFTICGRGGYNRVRIYRSPWRLVFPAMVLNFCLTLMSLEAACDFAHGFESFQNSLNKQLNRTGYFFPLFIIHSFLMLLRIPSRDEPLREYIQMRAKEDSNHVVWKYFRITKVASWIGAISWIFGLALLILRVINVTDFKLIRVSKYVSKRATNEPRGNDHPQDIKTTAPLRV